MTVERFLFKFDRELLDLHALELDETLVQFFKTIDIDTSGQFEMVNHQGLSRKFTINWEEKLLNSRGMKGFFSPYQGDYLLIGQTEDGRIEVSPPQATEATTRKASKRDNRYETVIDGMKMFRRDSEDWFQLYQIAQQFQMNTNADKLICLPYIREAQTFQYQVNTVKAILNRYKGRVMLSDEVGLGKTVEAGMAMLEYIMRGLVKKVLILTPPSLVQQWENEMKRKFNQDFIKTDDSAFKSMGDDAWAHYPKVIASLSTAKRKQHREAIFNQHYDLVIVDEAHHLRNRKTQAWKFINGINKKYIFLLTATPVQNHLEELYNLITLLKPGQLKTYSYFKKNFMESKDGIEVKNTDKLKGLVRDVMIRNKRSNVDVEFTKRKAFTTAVELPPEQQKLYEDISAFIRNKYREEKPSISRFQLKNLQEQMGSTYTSMLQTLERLASNPELSTFDQKALHRFSERAKSVVESEGQHNPKVNKLISILKKFDGKMLIFTKYKSTQQFLANLLRDEGFRVAEFHGGLKRKEKEEQIAYFKGDADVLVSTEVGGEGRNLQFCHGMINFDLPWNPMAIEQRIGRIHRIGQTNDVFVYNLVAKDTIEYYILDLLDRKINMFELVVGEVDAILGDMENDEEDFAELMMKAWAQANDKEDVQRELEEIGDKLFENKQKLIKQKELDDKLF
ncbi:DEAD/DEAH box helicase [Aquibacillus salsiterrae]|uniref:SNF2-related protein n=1 Tax=Aquibacillus salsiterrae TaxID=2950439 RepID=A0A9X4AG47_9BACI|nr:SNF2-related protein [Aquibacillus salsiterrae]MDC3418571.1 SNF2-related protein [Aquibacillus salsiterrae]